MTTKQKALQEKHGTPAQFHEALRKAWIDGWITLSELDRGYRKYRDEWNAAGEKKTGKR